MATPPPKLTSKPAGICSAYVPTRKGIPFDLGCFIELEVIWLNLIKQKSSQNWSY
jgi:hypothetical protein